jgi:hypothetical protein
MDENASRKPEVPEMLGVDAAQILEFWCAMVRPGDVHEIRIPKPINRRQAVISGYVDNVADFISMVEPYVEDHRAEAVYMTLNPVNPALLARSANRLKTNADTLSKDSDISHYRSLLIDIDPVRPAGISATDDERQAALQTGDRIVSFLSDQGWPLPVIHGSSGNGGILVYRLPDLPNLPESTALVKQVLGALAVLFDTDAVTIDTSVHNPSRLVKVLGTVAAKGDHTPDRPWRRAEGVCRVD